MINIYVRIYIYVSLVLITSHFSSEIEMEERREREKERLNKFVHSDYRFCRPRDCAIILYVSLLMI